MGGGQFDFVGRSGGPAPHVRCTPCGCAVRVVGLAESRDCPHPALLYRFSSALPALGEGRGRVPSVPFTHTRVSRARGHARAHVSTFGGPLCTASHAHARVSTFGRPLCTAPHAHARVSTFGRPLCTASHAHAHAHVSTFWKASVHSAVTPAVNSVCSVNPRVAVDSISFGPQRNQGDAPKACRLLFRHYSVLVRYYSVLVSAARWKATDSAVDGPLDTCKIRKIPARRRHSF